MLHPRSTYFTCLLLALAVLLPVRAVSAATPLRVMSFNVRTPADTAPGRRWEDRRAAMVAMLRDQHPDVVGTQELVARQAADLVAQLPGYRWFGRSRRADAEDEHMGVFYDTRRLRLVDSGDFWLSDTPDIAGSITWGNLYPRMVTWAVFERLDDRRRFRLLNTHLPYREEDAQARLRAADAILQHLAALPADMPVVLTGDFNSEPGSGAYRALTTALADARSNAMHRTGPAGTFHDFSGTPGRQLDWILVRGLAVEHLATLDQRPGGILPSDHFPVVADLVWPQD